VASLKAKGETIDPEKEKELLKTITDRYNSQTSAYYAAARLWVDEIIDPADTRRVISEGIAAANHAPITREWKGGVFQV
jgi:acetyl-CoA carboxylase carboxyltransferase component